MHLYPQRFTPFFGYNGGSSFTRTNQSSGVRIDDPDADFKLAKTINKIEARLLLTHSGAGWDWVIVFFSAVYRNSPKIVLARVLDVRRAQDTARTIIRLCARWASATVQMLDRTFSLLHNFCRRINAIS